MGMAETTAGPMTRRGWLLAPVGWLVAALLASTRGGMLIDNGNIRPIPWSERFSGALYELSWWLVLAPLVVIAVRRIERQPWPAWARILAHVAVGGLTCAAFFFLRVLVHLPGDLTRLGSGWAGFRSTIPSSAGLYLLIAAGAGLLIAVERAREREREAAELVLRASRLETQLVEAQLGMLRGQLHPHFLFNALHAISTLVDVRPKEARRMLTQLSELLRMALAFSREREVTLSRELEWLEHYVELQQVRFGDRLSVDIRVAPDAMTGLVPPLVLQPLVENAIKHGIESRPAGGRVEVAAERDGGRLRLSVRDDGPGPREASARTGTGTGLRNTADRLRTLYGDRQQVSLLARDTGGAEALVELPFRTTGAGEPALPGQRQ